MSELDSCHNWPQVPDWWWNGGMQAHLDRQAKEAQCFDDAIFQVIKHAAQKGQAEK